MSGNLKKTFMCIYYRIFRGVESQRTTILPTPLFQLCKVIVNCTYGLKLYFHIFPYDILRITEKTILGTFLQIT